MKNKQHQQFNDGVVKIYSVSNIAEPGKMPVETLELKYTLRYKERTVGLQRYYTALQANITVSHVLRCPFLRNVSTQDIAIPNDGQQYRIVQIQRPEDIDPPVMDLTLERVTQDYEIS